MSRGWLGPLSPVYRAVVAAKNSAYERGWIKSKRLRWPVVSVGNLSVGGAGKTPLTIRLAELLLAEGLGVDVLSRGYGRSSSAVERVDSDGSAESFGDEPLLIARRAGVPVFVGASRYEAALLAEGLDSFKIANEETGRRRIHLLDDGFQHRQLARDVDVVVVHRSDFEQRLLPAGRLREPVTALRRADFVVLREEDAEFEGAIRRLGVRAPVWPMRRSLEVPSEVVEAKRVVAFCGIARPEEFFAALTGAGVGVEATVAFADHHRYVSADMERVAKIGGELRAGAFVITEKDSVKLDAGLLKVLEAVAPVRVARLAVEFRDEGLIVRQLLGRLR